MEMLKEFNGHKYYIDYRMLRGSVPQQSCDECGSGLNSFRWIVIDKIDDPSFTDRLFRDTRKRLCSECSREILPEPVVEKIDAYLVARELNDRYITMGEYGKAVLSEVGLLD